MLRSWCSHLLTFISGVEPAVAWVLGGISFIFQTRRRSEEELFFTVRLVLLIFIAYLTFYPLCFNQVNVKRSKYGLY